MAFTKRFIIPQENITTTRLREYTSGQNTYTIDLTYCNSPVIFGNVGDSTRILTTQSSDIPPSDDYYFALAVSPFFIECKYQHSDGTGSPTYFAYDVWGNRTNNESRLGTTMSSKGASGYKDKADLQDIMLEMLKAFPYKLTNVIYPIGYPSINGAKSETSAVNSRGFYSNYSNREPTAFIPSLTIDSDDNWVLTCVASSTTEYKLQMPPLYQLAFAYAPSVSNYNGAVSFNSNQTPLVMVMPVLLKPDGSVVTDSNL